MKHEIIEEKNKVVRDILKRYLETTLEGLNLSNYKNLIKCESGTGFDECHVIVRNNTESPSFDITRDFVSNGTQLPNNISDFMVYVIMEKVDSELQLIRVIDFWADVKIDE